MAFNANIKYLGVTLDLTLSGTIMADSLIGKVKRRLRILYRKVRFLKFNDRIISEDGKTQEVSGGLDY